MDYRKITIEDLQELAKIYAETFNSDPWYDKWTQKTAEKRRRSVSSTMKKRTAFKPSFLLF